MVFVFLTFLLNSIITLKRLLFNFLSKTLLFYLRFFESLNFWLFFFKMRRFFFEIFYNHNRFFHCFAIWHIYFFCLIFFEYNRAMFELNNWFESNLTEFWIIVISTFSNKQSIEKLFAWNVVLKCEIFCQCWLYEIWFRFKQTKIS